MINKRNILIWLNNLGGISYKMILDMEAYFGSILEIWGAQAKHLYRILGGKSIIVDKMLNARKEHYLEELLLEIKGKDFNLITILDKDYPEKLKNIYNPPYVLFIKGNLKLDKPLIGMVGARKSTSYGRWAARKFARELVDWGIGIVSGLALGIDAESHKSAIDEGGYTIGVLGCGIDLVYPKSNYQLYKELELKGCIISEYGMGVPPLKHNFPARNRIISGLSDGVVVIEAGERSGTLITVGHALEQGKDVFALPGNINNYQSKGTNKLIKEGAKILLSIEDITEELEYKYNLHNKTKKLELLDALGDDELKIYNIIKREPIHIDVLSYKSELDISQLSTILTILEIKGYVQQNQGKIFTVCN